MTSADALRAELETILRARGFTGVFKSFDASTRTAEEAAETIGCSVSEIAKSLVFMGKETETPYIAVLRGIDRADEKALKALVGEKLLQANPPYVREATGFVIGGVPPFGHKTACKVFIEARLQEEKTIWAAAGAPNRVVNLSFETLRDVSSGTIAAFSKKPASR